MTFEVDFEPDTSNSDYIRINCHFLYLDEATQKSVITEKKGWLRGSSTVEPNLKWAAPASAGPGFPLQCLFSAGLFRLRHLRRGRRWHFHFNPCRI